MAWNDGRMGPIGKDDAPVAAFVARVREANTQLVVMEGTGGDLTSRCSTVAWSYRARGEISPGKNATLPRANGPLRAGAEELMIDEPGSSLP